MDYQQEDGMKYLDAHIVECRGRLAGTTTNVSGSFTRRQLDRIAPLSQADSRHLSHGTNPPAWVQAHMATRILAAKYLKYGR